MMRIIYPQFPGGLQNVCRTPQNSDDSMSLRVLGLVALMAWLFGILCAVSIIGVLVYLGQ